METKAKVALGGILLGAILWGNGGCASDSDSYSSLPSAGGGQYLRFSLTVNANGTIDREGNGYYAILLNSQGEAIEVTNSDTFTDFIRFDGVHFDWFTRMANLPNAGFTFYQVGSLSPESSISGDGRTINILLDPYDPNIYLNQYIRSSKFSAQAVTTDSDPDSYLGRVIDFMGDNINSNSLQTLLVDKFLGAVTPYPTFHPYDNTNDWIEHGDLGGDFPYVNFDIERFEVWFR